MEQAVITGWFTLGGIAIGALISSVVSLLTLNLKGKQDVLLEREKNKTETMAVDAARYYLLHSGYIDRSFELLKKRLGGFNDNELC